jgi:L-iditol 2-dehydrogenase
MKAVILHKNGELCYEDCPDPEVRPDSVKVRVRGAGICGSDIPRVFNNGAHFYPIILGHEFVGDVVEAGGKVTQTQIGDTVVGIPLIPCFKCSDCQKGNYALCKQYRFIGSRENGAFAEYLVIPGTNVIKINQNIGYDQAIFFEPSTVALHGLFCNDFRGGEYTAVIGAGTIGSFAMQWTKILGARKTIVFDIDEKRLSLAKRLGATETINTTDSNYMEQAMELTGGRGFPYVFEAVGNSDTVHMAFQLADNKGHVCFIGTPHKDLTFTPPQWEKLNRAELRITGSWMSYSSPFPGREWEMTTEYMTNGKLCFDPALIYKKIPLREAPYAFSLFKKPEEVKGKIMIIN